MLSSKIPWYLQKFEQEQNDTGSSTRTTVRIFIEHSIGLLDFASQRLSYRATILSAFVAVLGYSEVRLNLGGEFPLSACPLRSRASCVNSYTPVVDSRISRALPVPVVAFDLPNGACTELLAGIYHDGEQRLLQEAAPCFPCLPVLGRVSSTFSCS
ncbi:hypothetical protein HMN09_01327800 [Mycena chlorophos]|uniref:Uncharacterized protein n=1 Tax=Mycena chlorophos TaxID=658473 RepID=A0A8H6VTM4_MYCCL|nr:hypothetical protein HMN09_01327800 [Mycena chlorophos]